MGYLNYVNSQAVMNASRLVSITNDGKLNVFLTISMIAKRLGQVGVLNCFISHQK